MKNSSRSFIVVVVDLFLHLILNQRCGRRPVGSRGRADAALSGSGNGGGGGWNCRSSSSRRYGASTSPPESSFPSSSSSPERAFWFWMGGCSGGFRRQPHGHGVERSSGVGRARYDGSVLASYHCQSVSVRAPGLAATPCRHGERGAACACRRLIA